MAFISNGTTMLDAGAFTASLGSMVHIKTLTASNSGDLTFIDGSSSVVFDSTYPIYQFVYTNIHNHICTYLYIVYTQTYIQDIYNY